MCVADTLPQGLTTRLNSSFYGTLLRKLAPSLDGPFLPQATSSLRATYFDNEHRTLRRRRPTTQTPSHRRDHATDRRQGPPGGSPLAAHGLRARGDDLHPRQRQARDDRRRVQPSQLRRPAAKFEVVTAPPEAPSRHERIREAIMRLTEQPPVRRAAIKRIDQLGPEKALEMLSSPQPNGGDGLPADPEPTR